MGSLQYEQEGYLSNRHDLDEQMMAYTIQAYTDGAREYSDLALLPHYIDPVWMTVIAPVMDQIAKFDEDKKGKVLMAGDGTLRDSFIFLLLCSQLDVFAFDASIGMLQEGLSKLNWLTILLISALLYSRDRASLRKVAGNGLIQGIIHLIQNESKLRIDVKTINPDVEELLKQFSDEKNISYFVDDNEDPVTMPLKLFLRQATAVVSKEYRDSVVENVKERLHLKQGLLQSSERNFEEHTFDLVFAIATLQHLDKENSLIPALDNLIKSLSVGGTLYFNVRFDVQPTLTANGNKGRVFMDTIIGGERYYATMSADEIEMLTQYLSENYPDIEVTKTSVTHHPNAKKPWFYNFHLKRLG